MPTKISELTAITTPVDADLGVLVDDSAAATRKITWANIKATLKTYFDTLYGAASDVTALEAGEYAVNTVATSGATETLTLAPIHKVTMDQNCTFTFPTPNKAGHTFILHLIGSFTPTFPASVDWESATAPTYATPSIFVFHTDDTGTTWFGSMTGSGFG